MRKFILSAAALLILTGGFASAQVANARIRVVHASPDAPAVDITVNGARVLENLPYREYSEYLSVPPGAYTFGINVTGATTTVATLPAALVAGRDYTAIAAGYALGGSPRFEVLVLEDDNTLPANNGVKIRVVHGAPAAPGVDVYVTTPFETLEGKTATLSNVPFKGVSGYLTVPVGNYQARVAVAGTRTVAIDSHRLVTWANMIRTVIAVDARGGGAPFDFIILPDRN